MPTYLYLHGFASSPQSAKAQYLSARFAECGESLRILDLNQGGFCHLTLSRQLAQAKAALPLQEPAIAIGSSFGGLTVAWLAEQCPQIERLIGLAPAFNFLPTWRSRLSATQWQQWQTTRRLSVYHYGEQRQQELDYGFIEDLANYDETALQRPLPTLILHGRQDAIVPIQAARDYQRDRPWVELVQLDSDHSLGNVRPQIWQAIARFCPELALAG
ncbi:MAG: prolyl oligopeptidase family serine peptidase [Spirulinaceae cyanobacterium SM2_1_0]|nr:prolyl oligopeptidase family serine peptidase [Spirulinaceae cyanobacterium SM2_1_0]